jgi:uncharacterized protein YodC (DUF2158 family)
MEFKVGAKVRLKSGGPRMTVTGLDRHASTGEQMLFCTWFPTEVSEKESTSRFPAAALEAENDTPGSVTEDYVD